jgi:hypothetical protein
MSAIGVRRLELERQRQEVLRRERVREECDALRVQCLETLRKAEAEAKAFAGPELAALSATLEASRREADVDAALAQVAGCCARVQGVLASGRAAAQRWSAEVAARQSRLEVLRARLDSAPTGDAERARAAATRGREALGRAAGALAVADLAAADAALDAAEGDLSAVGEAAQVEAERREAVRRLRDTLREMGFVPAVGLQIEGERSVVVLEGRMPSGRRAQFRLSLDGDLAFDLDGYEGRACAEDLERVETVLRDRYGVRLGPPQITWKNPDRLAKGARELPGGGAAARKKG